MRFWDASGVCLRLLYKLSTVRVFLTDTDLSENLSTQGEEEWPPLRKVSWEPGNQGHGEPSWDRPVTTHGLSLPCQVGSFDPYSDDPRLGIQKIFLCKYSGYLAVAGTAGQVAGRAGWGLRAQWLGDFAHQEQEPLSGSNIWSTPAAFASRCRMLGSPRE